MRYLLGLLAALGIIVSSLALRVHYSTDIQPCDINAKWDCGVVNHSHFAVVHGIPVAAIGIAGYTMLTLLALSGFRKPLAFFSLLGLSYALYLTHIEHDLLQVWCVFCVASQTIIALLFLLSAVWAFHKKKTA